MTDDWRGESLIRTIARAPDETPRCRVCRTEIDPRAEHCHRHKPAMRDKGRYAPNTGKET